MDLKIVVCFTMEYDFAIKQNELLTNNMNEFQKYVKSKKPEHIRVQFYLYEVQELAKLIKRKLVASGEKSGWKGLERNLG